MDSSWMNDVCGLLGDRGIRTVRFEFAYMAGRREGVRRPPPKAESSMGEYRDAVAEIVGTAGSPVVIGGKSYGGRVASLVADELHAAGTVSGLVCLGYPFHPPEKPAQPRTAHLLALQTPALICQGTRDPFGGSDEVPGYGLPPTIEVRWFDDGDHDLRPRKAISGHTVREHLTMAADAVAVFARSVVE
jgi:predicted alpha/beta-hydrolase family hydrolase